MINDFLCFDTESAQGRLMGKYTEELLELSIMNIACEEIFSHRFKPTLLRKWDPSVHKITPEMVSKEKRFRHYQGEIQRLFDNARYIIGFSLIDDFKAMERAGITGFDNKTVIELRHLHWLCVGREAGTPFYSGPGLTACATAMGVHVDDALVHSAGGDTQVTLQLFFKLLQNYVDNFCPGRSIDPASDGFELLIADMLKDLERAKFEYDRTLAAGYVVVKRVEQGAQIVTLAARPENEEDYLLVHPVNARRRAHYEIELHLAKKRIGNSKSFRLNDKDLNWIKQYQNEFDQQEQYYAKLIGLRRGIGGTR